MGVKMTSGKPLTLIFKFMVPIFFGYLFQELYNMVDTVIVGRFVGPNALAAVGSTGTIVFMILGIAIGLATGFAVLTSQRYGAGDEVATRRSFANGILLSFISIGVLTAISLLLMHQILHVMSTPADIYEDAYAYIFTICAGCGTIVFYNFFAASLRAIGDSRHPLYFLVVSTILNIALDLFFIIVLKLGTMGAALATNVAQGTSAVLCFIYIMRRVPSLRPQRGDFRLRRSCTAQQLNIGVPMALQFGITASGTMVMQAAINIYGSIAVGGFTAASKVVGLMTSAMPAFGQTMASYVGQNYGYGDMNRVHQGTKAAMLIATIYSVAAGVLTVVLLPYAISLFFDAGVDLSAYMPYAKIYCYESVFFYIPLSMIFIYRNTMQGCGYGKTTLALGFMELGARLVAAALSRSMGSYALAAGGDPIAWGAAGVLAFFLYLVVRKRETKRLGKKKEGNSNV